MPKTHPIVLAHGIARFDELSRNLFKVDNKDELDGLHYFRNIRTHLEARGFDVHHSNVEWAAGVRQRSTTLRKNVDAILAGTGADKVHIIAHSMGGLDSRQMLFDGRDDGLHGRVASLTTIGTPHHGSPAADVLEPAAPKNGSVLGIDIAGLHDLTTAACEAFNAEKAEWESTCGVAFRAYAGAQPFHRIFGPLKATWALIKSREGDNDGLVSVRSARWNDEYFADEVDADHLNLVGWWDADELLFGDSPFELEERIKGLYLSIASTLAQSSPLP